MLNDKVKEEVYQIKYFGDNCLSRVLWMIKNTVNCNEQLIYIEIIRELYTFQAAYWIPEKWILQMQMS